MNKNNRSGGEYRKETPEGCESICVREINNGFILTYRRVLKDANGHENWESEKCLEIYTKTNPFAKNITVSKSLIDLLREYNNTNE